MRNPAEGAADAARFLTVLPLPGGGARSLAGSLPWFPVVGAALGLGLGGLGLLLDRWLPPGPVAAVLIAAGICLTGGLHLDGLMDTADGVFGGRTPARRLEIMRDSRVGAFGVLAGVLAILLQWSSLSEVRGWDRLRLLVVALATARWAMVGAVVLFPSARAGGLGASMKRQADQLPLAFATIAAVAVALLVGEDGAIGLVAGGLVAGLAAILFSRRLGGLTGDTYGAVCVLAETAVLVALLAVHVGPG